MSKNSKRTSDGQRFAWLLAGCFSLLCVGSAVGAVNRTWTGGGADNNWDTATNWGGAAPVANDLLIFDGTTRLTNTNNIAANTAFPGITFNSTAGAFTLRGNALNLAGGVTNNCLTNAETISLNMALTATQTFDVASGGTLSIGGVISGNKYGVTKVDAGTLTLSGVNTYAGGTTINSGTLLITADNNLGGSGSLTFANGGRLLNTGTGGQSSSRAITLNSGGGVISMNGPTMTLTGSITGGGGLASSGSDLILQPSSGNNNIGPMTVNSGRLFVFNTGAINGSDIVVNNGATIDFGSSAPASPANTMTFSSGACLANRLSSALTLSTTTSTFPSAGTMIFNADDQATTAITVSGAYPTLTGDLTIQVGGSAGVPGNVTLSAAISGSYGLLKSSNGILILSGANSYTGDTTLSAGTLRLGAANVVPDGSGKGNVTVNGTLDLGGFSDTINGLSGSGKVDNSVGTGAYTLTVGNNDQTSTFSGTITDTTGTLSLTKVGAGILTLSGTNSFSGVATVLAGTLEVQKDGGLGSVTNVSVGPGATLTLDSGTSNNYINDAATVSLTNTAVMNITFIGSDTVANLYVNGVHKRAGTWGASGSGATCVDDTHFQGTGVLNVTAGPTSGTTVSGSPNPSNWGSLVTFIATVTGTNGVPPPTGTVTFKDGTTILGTGTLTGSPTATATFSTTGLASGAHTITAIYSGDSNFTGSTSANLTQTVKANATATLIPSLNPACFGQSLTFTATVAVVAPGVGTPTGTVTFKDGATSLATNALSSGQATFTTSTLSAASHLMIAVYNGDANFQTNTSAVVTQKVNAVPTATLSGGGTICQGNNMNIQAALTGNSPWTVVWSDGVIQTNITVSPATRSVRPSSTTTYTVTSVSGANCSGSSTGSATVTVNPAVSVTPLTDLERALGADAVFSTTASGTGPFVYAWQKNGTVIAGQTKSSLILTNLVSADGGVYRVVVSGGCGSASSIATLLVNSCFPSVDMMLVIDRSGSMLGQKYSDAQQACSNFVQNLDFAPHADQVGLASYNTNATLDLTLTNSLQGLGKAIHAMLAASGNTSISLGLQTGQNELISARHNLNALPAMILLSDGLPTGTDTKSNALYTATQAKEAGTLIFTIGLGSDVDPVLMAGVASSTNYYFFATNSSQLSSLFTAISTLICRPPTNIFINGLFNLTVCAGSPANFSVTVTANQTNCAPYGYQWEKNGVRLAGQTNSFLLINAASVSDAGTYSLEVSSVCRTITNSATLTVNTPVQVVGVPVDITSCPGTSAQFSVTATGSGLTYQWYKGSSSLSGQTGSSLSLNNVSVEDAGMYGVVVSGVCGSAVTNRARLAVTPTLVVSMPPADVTTCAGTSARFDVAVKGAGLSYQWYKNSSALPGQMGSSLVLANVSAADAGNYSLVVSGTCGSAVTNSASLTVNQNVFVASAPLSVTNCPGTTASFSVSATGAALSYQWYKGTIVLTGQTGSSLTLNNVGAADAGMYSVVVSGACGSVTYSASLTVNQSVVVISAPASVTNCLGASATFAVSATGTGLSYQWYKGGIALTSQTGSNLSLNNVSASDAGIYSVMVSAVCGSPASQSATLTVNENVAVVSGPVGVTNCPGSSAGFSVSATGTELSYQWYKGTTALTGRTGTSLLLSNVSASDAGTYCVVVIGTCGNAVSNSASLAVNQNVTVGSAPVSVANCPGTTASFSVSATGTGLSFQWYKGTTALAGQTGSSLVLANVSAANAGTYSVVVSGTCGNVMSNSASLTVNQNVAMASAPVSVTNCLGATASFTVSATGTGLSYQWYKGGNALAGQTSSSLSLNKVSASDAGIYSVTVSGVCGSPVSQSATLTVNQNVAVVSGPVSVTNCPGSSASFTVSATGTGLSYQWYKGTTALTGQTGSSLMLANVSASDARTYSVVVSGTCGNAVSNSASLAVNQNVVVSTTPVSMTNCPGTSASFSVNATGTGLGYQWYSGTNELTGQTNSSLVLNNVAAGDGGAYSVVVSGACGQAVMNSASLTVNQNVAVVSGPVSVTNCPGSSASFSVSATGTGLSYQWYKGGNALAGRTSSSLSLNNVSASDAGTYGVVVSGTCGQAVTNSASLTVNQNVAVVSGPASVTNCPGSSASFTVSATGTGLSYQWYNGTTALTGQTGSSLVLANVSASDAGTYGVAVTGTCGQSVSNSARLTVNRNVAVSSVPVSVTNCPGTTASFSVSATGTGLSYQWYKGTTVLTGQTASSLALSKVSASDVGTYCVVVSGTCGNAVSNSASLAVNQNVVVSTAPVSLTNCPGTTASFTVSATGTGLSYQWYKGTTALTGQTSSSLVLANVSASDAGTYSVVVSGTCGNAVSNSSSLTVNQNVVVSTAPVSVTNCLGTSASFTVSAMGTGLSYQWYKGTTALTGQTGSGLVLANVSAANAGIYSVVVSGTCGNGATNSASLTVNQNVVVSTAPVSVTNCLGTSASFTVSAMGTGLSYQWYKGTTALTGQTGSGLMLANVSAANAGIYSMVVSGTCGNGATNSASLTVNQNVVVSTAPVSVTNCPGTSASFTVSATGTGLSYQWYKGTMALMGQTGSSLVLANVSAANAGSYSVVVSGTCGNAVSNSASLTVNQNVVVSTAPVSMTNCPGTSTSFIVSATGTGLSYQWYKGTMALTGQTGSSLVLDNVNASDARTYSVVVSGTCGNAVSNSASLTVNQNLQVVNAPVSLNSCPGSSASFTVSGTGTGLSYQWYKETTALTGQTGSSLVLANVNASDAGTYSVVVSGICGSAVTNSAGLKVNQNILLTSAPVNLTNCPGTSASFNVSATGTGLSYQWYTGGSPLVGQTASSLALANVSASDAGTYTVVVSGTCGSAISNSAVLTVNATTVATPMASVTNNLGTSVTFATVGSGTGPLTYAWKKNGTNIIGATTASLTLTNLGYAHAGVYTVEVAGTCNTTEQSATLTINIPPTVSIVNPTNGTVFIAPANFTVLADAQDVDGTVTNVQFFYGTTNFLGETFLPPYGIVLTNVPVGSYSFSAIAADNLGASGTSAPVSITVIASPPLSIMSAMSFNPQTDLFQQTVRVSNPTSSTYHAVRVYVYGLTNNTTVYNASGSTNGIQYVESLTPIAPGG